MPPRTHSTYALPSKQLCRNAIRDVVQFATELDPSRGGSGLAGATLRQRLHLGRALTQLCDAQLHALSEEAEPLLFAPDARAALVQHFSSALRIFTPAGPRSSAQLSTSGSGYPTDGGVVHTSRPAGTAGLDNDAAASSRPTDRQTRCYMEILAACANLIYSYFACEIKEMSAAGTQDVSLAWLQTAQALLQGDALAALGRLFAADNRLPAGAKLLPMQVFVDLQNLASLLLAVSSVDNRFEKGLLLRQLANSHLLEHWAKELVGRAGAVPASSGRRSRGQGGSGTGTSADTDLSALFYSFQYVTDHLTTGILRSGNEQSAACADAARQQLLSGRCLQYLTDVRAVSQLYVAAGGALYGLPHEALMLYLLADRLPVERKGQEALSCGGLRSSIALWDTCLDLCPPKALRPLRPRHLLELCLRTARVALASFEEADTQQQQQQQQGQDTAVAAGCSVGGASSAGRLGGVLQALLGPMRVRRRLDAKESPELAVAAMELARSLVVARVRRTGGGAGEAPTEDGNGSSCDGATGTLGCGGNGGGDGGGAVGGGCGDSGSGNAGPGQPGEGQPRAVGQLLLGDPSFADGWWRLALGVVRAALQQDRGREQQQLQQWDQEQDGWDVKVLVKNAAVRCSSLLLPLDLAALDDCGGCKHRVVPGTG